MKAKFLSIAVVLLAGGAHAALAQDHDHDQARDHHRPPAANAARPDRRQPTPAPQPPQARAAPAAPRPAEGSPPRGHDEHHAGGPPAGRGPGPAATRQADAHRDGDRRGDWDRGHDARPRWSPRDYPRSYHSHDRFHGPDWRPPSGYYVRAWRYGEVLPRGWYGADYRIGDWWSYGLPGPPPGYFWVRVGPDVVLVDGFNGRIVQIVRYVFW
jgi:Ni/Co efflux regulator RcnB